MENVYYFDITDNIDSWATSLTFSEVQSDVLLANLERKAHLSYYHKLQHSSEIREGIKASFK